MGLLTQRLTQAPLHRHVFAGDFGDVELVGPASGAQVGVALPHRQETGALLRVAGGLTSAPGEPVLACKQNKNLSVKKTFSINKMELNFSNNLVK